MNTGFDWNLLQSFIAVADAGSLSGAAREHGGSQPTMGRHIGALEAELGVRLFERTGQGLELTATGTDLLEHARHMAAAAGRLSLSAEGRSLRASFRLCSVLEHDHADDRQEQVPVHPRPGGDGGDL